MARFIDELSMRWRTGDILTRLIFVNVAVFIVLRMVAIIITLSGGDADSIWIKWFELPSDLLELFHRPWTVVTYMFTQYGVFHLLFNILWLYWFGRFFLYGNTPKQLFALYIYGGLGGAVLYLAAFNCMPYFEHSHGLLLGSSASVLAIVVATAWRMPDFRVGVIFIGDIALKWIAIVIVLFSLLNVSGENAGGNIAHIGGALMGMAYGYFMNRGRDISVWFNNALDSVVNYCKHPFIIRSRDKKGQSDNQYGSNRQQSGGISPEENASLDMILDKIKKSGYASLSADERQRLFRASSKLK